MVRVNAADTLWGLGKLPLRRVAKIRQINGANCTEIEHAHFAV